MNRFPPDGRPKATTETSRVYDSIKAMIIEHELPLGKRILVEHLADDLNVSNTPVREVLIHLAAERLIRDEPKAGFFTKEISGLELQNLYMVNQALLDLSLSCVRNKGQGPGMLKPPQYFNDTDEKMEHSPAAFVKILNDLFIHIARQSGNIEILHGVKNINDRTYFFRLQACDLLEGFQDSLLEMCQLYYHKKIDELRQALKAYHEKMIGFLPELLLLLRRSRSEFC